jgi:diadenosine tetraphosphate (Ap4A) HIT family hydrolase
MKYFLNIPKEKILGDNEHFILIKDVYPVSPGHLLIISKHLRKDFFSLTDPEKKSLTDAIDIAKQKIELEYNPDGYNIGMNCGDSAGQTIFHFHCHVIPRYNGDMEDPRGGIRHCIEGKGYY